MKKTLILLFISFNFCSFGQKNTNVSYGIGINWQSTVMNFWNFRFVNGYGYPRYFIPHNYERNIQGLGIPLYFRVHLNDDKAFFEYSPNFRYDEIYYLDDSTKKFHVTPVKAFIINQSFSFNRRFYKNKSYLKAGVTWFNPFKTIPTEKISLAELNYVASINYISLDLGYGFIFPKKKKYELNINAHYISKGQMLTILTKNAYMSYSVKLLYNIKGISH